MWIITGYIFLFRFRALYRRISTACRLYCLTESSQSDAKKKKNGIWNKWKVDMNSEEKKKTMMMRGKIRKNKIPSENQLAFHILRMQIINVYECAFFAHKHKFQHIFPYCAISITFSFALQYSFFFYFILFSFSCSCCVLCSCYFMVLNFWWIEFSGSNDSDNTVPNASTTITIYKPTDEWIWQTDKKWSIEHRKMNISFVRLWRQIEIVIWYLSEYMRHHNRWCRTLAKPFLECYNFFFFAILLRKRDEHKSQKKFSSFSIFLFDTLCVKHKNVTWWTSRSDRG